MGDIRVLVVDDEPDIRATVSEMLEIEGYGVLEAAHGRAALDLLAGGSTGGVNLILLDMRMPVLDGWQFAAVYRALAGPRAPIVVMTAAQDARAWCAQIRADGCLAKPFELDELLRQVERLTA